MIIGIVAADNNFGIGKNNGLLFKLNQDLQYFKEKTKYQIVVMGYNTYMSLPKRPLKDRVNIILWDNDKVIDDCITFHNFNDLLVYVKNTAINHDVFICGGASVYKLFLPYYDKIYLTKIDSIDKEATVFFPNIDEMPEFEITNSSEEKEENGIKFKFLTYNRKKEKNG